MEHRENQTECCCECCHCKKIFMMLVLLILSFIAGIMVGHCQSQYPMYMHHYTPYIQSGHMKAKNTNSQTQQQNSPNKPDQVPNAQIGGFIMEVEQGQ